MSTTLSIEKWFKNFERNWCILLETIQFTFKSFVFLKVRNSNIGLIVSSFLRIFFQEQFLRTLSQDKEFFYRQSKINITKKLSYTSKFIFSEKTGKNKARTTPWRNMGRILGSSRGSTEKLNCNARPIPHNNWSFTRKWRKGTTRGQQRSPEVRFLPAISELTAAQLSYFTHLYFFLL